MVSYDEDDLPTGLSGAFFDPETCGVYRKTDIESKDRLIRELVKALDGVLRVADRATDEFDAARTAFANAKAAGYDITDKGGV